MSQDYDSVIRKFGVSVEKFKEAKQKLQDEFKENLESFVEAVLRQNEFPCIVIQGYKPLFNDGDVCEFTLSVEAWEFDKVVETFSSEEKNSDLSFLPPDTKIKAVDFSNLDNIAYENETNKKNAKKLRQLLKN